ncbi:DUF58 domain-containing protein [Thalassolituus sp. LLYu03]|uniref:DUF58 domain-containing protein n=1 Tax=Thalassolituus sp. LLYu03 TaxID=3421656 RepID=UPI003D28B3E0
MSQSTLEHQLRPLFNLVGRYLNAHRFLWLMSLVCFLVAWNRGMALLYGMVALMLALILVSWVMPWWALRGVRMERTQQGQAVAGQQVKLSYRFTLKHPLFFIRVQECIPDVLPADCQRFLPSIAGSDDITLTYPVARRGVYNLPAPDITCAWPFGFVQRRTRLQSNDAQLVVMPKTFRIRQLPQLTSNNPLPLGDDSYLSRQAHSEFAGVRPFREGDSMKHVHWSASARQQQLVVREFHSFDTPSWLVLVDGQVGAAIGEGADSSFEYAIQIAASALLWAQSHDQAMTLVVGGRRPLTLKTGPGMHNGAEHVQALAWVQDDGHDDYQSLINRELAARQDVPMVMTIRRDSQSLTLPPGLGHLDIVFSDDSFRQPLGRYREGWQSLGPGCERLHLHRASKLHQVFAS